MRNFIFKNVEMNIKCSNCHKVKDGKDYILFNGFIERGLGIKVNESNMLIPHKHLTLDFKTIYHGNEKVFCSEDCLIQWIKKKVKK